MAKELESIYKNPWLAGIIAFVLAALICWLFKFGYKNKETYTWKDINWAYPAAIGILIFVTWYFCLFPSKTLKGELDIDKLEYFGKGYF